MRANVLSKVSLVGVLSLALSLLVAQNPAQASNPTYTGRPMTITVNVNAGDSVELPFGDAILDSAETVDVSVNWGDTFTTNHNSVGIASHTYTTAGVYQISIGPGQAVNGPWLTIFGVDRTGDGSAWNNYSIPFTSVDDFGDLGITSLSSAFFYAGDLTSVPATLPTHVTHMNSLFRASGLINDSNIALWDVSSVVSMVNTFSGAGTFNQNLENWNVSNVTSMVSMFEGADDFNQPLNNWNVANVTRMDRMFFNASAFNKPLNSWNVSNVTSMTSMLRNIPVFNQNLNSWNVSNVTDFNEMFRGSSSYNQPMSNWNTSAAASMNGMFHSATNFNQNLSTWNTTNVVGTQEMFKGATSFNQSLANWNVSNFRYADRMFDGATAFTDANYEATLIGWYNSLGTPATLGASANRVLTCAGVSARDSLTVQGGWTINDLPTTANCSVSPSPSPSANPSATISGYGFESATLSSARKSAIRRFLASVPTGSTLTCTGSTAGTRVTTFARKLAKERATKVCDYAKSRRSDLRIRIALNPASGPTKAARKVVLTFQ